MNGLGIQQGSIVRAFVPDANGFVKSRPLLIISPTNEIILDKPVAALEPTSSECWRLPAGALGARVNQRGGETRMLKAPANVMH